MAMARREFHGDPCVNLARPTPHLGHGELQALMDLDVGSVLRTTHRVADRFTGRLDTARNHQSGPSGGHVNLTAHRRIDGLQYRAYRGQEDVPNRGPWHRFLPVKDLPQGLTLCGIGSLVDEDLHGPVPLMDRSRPLPRPDRKQPIEARRAEVTCVDLKAGDAHTVAVRR